MPATLAELHDRILDTATQAGIQRAEEDYPRFLQLDALSQAATGTASAMLATVEIDDAVAFLKLYTGIFVAAYRLRSRTLSAAPSSSHQSHSLKN